MKKTREIHYLWSEWQTIPAEMKNHLFMKRSLVGKWHYHYENKNGVIGLIKIQVPIFSPSFKMNHKYMWEACGILEFQRFHTKKEAEKEIYKSLKEPYKK